MVMVRLFPCGRCLVSAGEGLMIKRIDPIAMMRVNWDRLLFWLSGWMIGAGFLVRVLREGLDFW